ncbi:MAG: hypothetical protein ABR501_01905 [Pyrinomonadaceae bacterium]
MTRIRFIVISTFMVVACVRTSSAQEWRGIKPLRSTCEDVKRVLGVDRCQYPRSTYRLEDEIIEVSFVTCPCPIICRDTNPRWNLPSGTVTSIHRELLTARPIADFNVDQGKWTKIHTDFIGEVIYSNDELGLRLSAVEGDVLSITYYAPFEDNKQLLCQKCSVPHAPKAKLESPSLWFNAYGNLSFDEEKKRLDKFTSKLEEHGSDSVGYIVAYGGCRALKGEAQTRAERAKEYVVRAHGIDGNRIKTIDGGQRDEMVVELHIRARRLPPPITFSSTYPRVAFVSNLTTIRSCR